MIRIKRSITRVPSCIFKIFTGKQTEFKKPVTKQPIFGNFKGFIWVYFIIKNITFVTLIYLEVIDN